MSLIMVGSMVGGIADSTGVLHAAIAPYTTISNHCCQNIQIMRALTIVKGNNSCFSIICVRKY